jgi:excisionase family DNA binding protein
MPTLVSDFPETVTPTEAEVRLARESLELLTRLLDSNPADPRFGLHQDGDAMEPIGLPFSAIRLLKDILSEMAKGHGVALLPLHAELTTQQAADMLNVSRPFVIRLLEEAKLPFRLVGKHRRVRLDDVIAYKRRDDQERLKVLEELVAQSQELNMGY